MHCRILESHLHAIKVARIKIRAFWIVHPGNLIFFFRGLGWIVHPFVQICSDGSHFLVKLSSFCRCSVEHVPVNAENCFMNARLNPIKFDNVYKGFDIRPMALIQVGSFLVR
jgi:hypothetical protein